MKKTRFLVPSHKNRVGCVKKTKEYKAGDAGKHVQGSLAGKRNIFVLPFSLVPAGASAVMAAAQAALLVIRPTPKNKPVRF